ncbi:MAG: RdgB/HAM1 family non-canonical purine NTP pyrophosphatase [Saprospiraceae bacterium]
MQLNIATNNEHKLEELRFLLPEYTILGLKDLGIDAEIDENGNTLEDNALIKAKYLYNLTKTMSIGEDTGLEVIALNGSPGVKSARYASSANIASANISKLLANMEGVQDRRARFRTVIAVVMANGNFQIFDGKVNGVIADMPKGSSGFGYDPIFIPDGYSLSFGEMTQDKKNAMSHRARAVEKLIDFIKILNQ